jgi:hypothetical protein
MLDALSSSMTSNDVSYAEALERSERPGATDPLDAPLGELMAAASKLVAAVRVGPGLSARARAELERARHLLDALGAAAAAKDVDVGALMVAEDGTWFQTPSGRVDVARRGAVRRLLLALSRARLGAPSKALGVDELFAIGWPGEKIPYESQVRRVYTAIWTLRTLGLDGLLLTRDEGYLLDPKQTVRLAA